MKDHSSLKPQIDSGELIEVIAEPLSSDDDHDSLIVNDNIIYPDIINTESQENSHPNGQLSNNTTVEVVTTTADVAPIATPLLLKWKKDNEKRDHY